MWRRGSSGDLTGGSDRHGYALLISCFGGVSAYKYIAVFWLEVHRSLEAICGRDCAAFSLVYIIKYHI